MSEIITDKEDLIVQENLLEKKQERKTLRDVIVMGKKNRFLEGWRWFARKESIENPCIWHDYIFTIYSERDKENLSFEICGYYGEHIYEESLDSQLTIWDTKTRNIVAFTSWNKDTFMQTMDDLYNDLQKEYPNVFTKINILFFGSCINDKNFAMRNLILVNGKFLLPKTIC